MNTYLVFFGKSQDFIFYVFDRNQYISDFNSVIKDFDELESKIFTIDDISNGQILSKYQFVKDGTKFSLLKLYSLAQAFDGSRIGGSIYGVGLLSTEDIDISDVNISILKSTKKLFAKLSLDGVKFKSSNFYNEAEKIWQALLNQNGVNYFDRIESHSLSNNINNKVRSFFVKDLLKDPASLNTEIQNASRLYFSDDFAHLKRTQNRWGKETFPIYRKEGNSYILYKEIPIVNRSNIQVESDNISDLKIENGNLKQSLEKIEFELNKRHKSENQRNRKIIAILGCMTFFFVVLSIWGMFFSNNDEKRSEPIIKHELVELPQPNIIYDILADSLKELSLKTLITNKQEFKNKREKKFLDAIVRDAKGLNLAFDSLAVGDTSNLIQVNETKQSNKKQSAKKK